MSRYHINAEGHAELCEAHGNCEYGIGSENHYATEYEAKSAELRWHRDHSPMGAKDGAAIQRGMAAYAGGGGMGSSF